MSDERAPLEDGPTGGPSRTRSTMWPGGSTPPNDAHALKDAEQTMGVHR